MLLKLSKNQNHIVFIASEFKEGFATSTMIGAVEWDAATFKTADEALKAAQKLQDAGNGWEFGQKQDSGLYEMVRL